MVRNRQLRLWLRSTVLKSPRKSILADYPYVYRWLAWTDCQWLQGFPVANWLHWDQMERLEPVCQASSATGDPDPHVPRRTLHEQCSLHARHGKTARISLSMSCPVRRTHMRPRSVFGVQEAIVLFLVFVSLNFIHLSACFRTQMTPIFNSRHDSYRLCNTSTLRVCISLRLESFFILKKLA